MVELLPPTGLQMSGNRRVSPRSSGQRKSTAHRNAEKAADVAHRRKAKFARNARAQAATVQPWARLIHGVRAETSPLPTPPIPARDPLRTGGTPDLPSPLKTLTAGCLVACLAAVLISPQLRPRALSIALASRGTVTITPPPPAISYQAAGRWISATLTGAQPVAAHEAEEAVLAPGGAPQAAHMAGTQATALSAPQPLALDTPKSEVPAASLSEPQVAAIERNAPPLPPSMEQGIATAPLPPGAAAVANEREMDETSCSAESGDPARLAPPSNPSDFGRTLAAAASRQTRDLGIYTDQYRTLKFPMGDVPRLFGVCTDVVIRAYRLLGIDLQSRVHAARVGSGDASIAHRRTFTLRRYFASRGASLAVTDFAEDYLPGDVVTYFRPQNSGSRDHIAIVADMIGPSGRPMIIHNRGWGPQIEDALFVDKITGHYRYGHLQDQLAQLALKPKLKAPPSAEKKDGVQMRRKAKAISAMLKARAAAAGGIKK